MVKIKLQAVAQGLSKSLDKGVKNAVAAGAGVGGAVGGAVGNGVGAGLTGVFSLGKGFRDFILRGTVVELAVAVVLGTAFTNLISAVTADFITPLIGAIFRGSNFWELSFDINGSTFRYGHFINEFIVFLLVCLVLYMGVVVPLNKLQFAAFKHKAIMRDCPRCLEEISMAASRCKFCCAELELDDEMRAVMDMAEAAMEAEEQKQSWYMRYLMCCFKPKTALLQQTDEGDVELKQVDASELEHRLEQGTLASRGSSVGGSLSRRVTSSSGSGTSCSRNVSRLDEFASPNASFTTAADIDATAIDMEELEAACSQIKAQ